MHDAAATIGSYLTGRPDELIWWTSPVRQRDRILSSLPLVTLKLKERFNEFADS